MKYLFILYCTYIWCMELCRPSHFNVNEIFIKRPEIKSSRYVYAVEHRITTESTNIQMYNSEATTSESFTTGTLQNICNVSSSGNGTIAGRTKRTRHYGHTEIADTSDFSILSDEFIDCTHTTVEPECYQMFPNKSVYVPLYKRLFDRSNYVINKGFLFICPDFFDQLEEKFSSNIGIISIVGTSVSAVCIILHMIMFCFVKKLRNLPGYCLFSLCTALLITYMVFFIQYEISEQADCKVIGMFMMYSLLASFFWMNVISIDVWNAIRLATAKLRLTTDQSMVVRFTLYSCYAWGMPVAIIIIAVIVDNLTENDEYKLIFRKTTCWFQYRTALLLYFALPVFVLIVTNIIFFIQSFLMISRSRSDSGSQDTCNLRSRLFVSLRLGSAMGFMWIFGIIATATQKEWIYYLHSLCTALQGVFIFFSFTINKKTKKAVKKAIENKKISVLSSQGNEKVSILSVQENRKISMQPSQIQ